MTQHQATYTSGSVFRHLSSLSMISGIGLFALFVVDVVDMFFIALLGEPELAAAVGFAGVGLFLGAAVSIGVSIAIATLVAQSLGEKNEEQARRYATHGLLYSLFWTIPLTAITLYFAPDLLAFIGADDETLPLAVSYFRIVGSSLPILGLAMAATAVLRSAGDATRSMWSTIIGGIVNAIFDPIFIFLLAFNLQGAALASVLSRFTVAGVALWGLYRKHRLFCLPHWPSFWKDTKELSRLALPSIITNLSGPVGSAYATSQMARFGTDAVAAASVIGRITPVAFAGLYGLSGAVGPIASQNVGAKAFHRVKETLYASVRFAGFYVIPVALLLYLLQGTLIELFQLDGEAEELLSFYATFIVITYLLFALQLAANPIFTALRHPGLGTISNFTRDLFLALPLIALFASLFGAKGVLAGQALANALAGIASFSVALWLARRVERTQDTSQALVSLKFLTRNFHCHRATAPGVQHRGH